MTRISQGKVEVEGEPIAATVVIGADGANGFAARSLGLGGAIVYYGNQFATAKLLVIVIVLSLLGVALTQGARALERRLALWKETERAP